jgi:sec-independent protein translocase protein TatA
MLSDLKGWEFLILAALVVLLFGGKRLPDAARGLGRSLRIFKSETRGLREDDEAAATTTATQVPPAQAIPPVTPVVVTPVEQAPVVVTPVEQAPVQAPIPAPVQNPAPQAQPVQQAPESGEH